MSRGARPAPAERTAQPELARARERFHSQDGVPPGLVRRPILESWHRSRDHRVSTDHFALHYTPDQGRSALLMHSAREVLAQAGTRFGNEPVSVILTDANGVVLDRRIGDPHLRKHLDRVSLAPGFSYAEEFVGTNGIGTALEGRGPAHVFGHEHYVEHLEELACAGVPIHHPGTHKVLGVLDITCWRSDANLLLVTTAADQARRIEEALLRHAGRRELALLHEYLAACQRNRGAVLAISDDLVMLNDAARMLIDPVDQIALIGMAGEALTGDKPVHLRCPLPSGVTVQVHCRPTWSGPVAEGVVTVQVAVPAPRSGEGPPPPSPLPGVVGCGALWTSCCQDVHRHLVSRERLLLVGEAGTGKLTIATGVHLAHNPAGHLRVFDGDELRGADQPSPASVRWLAAVRKELQGRDGTLILRHIDRLPHHVQNELGGLLDRYGERHWVVATRAVDTPESVALARLVGRFPHTVTVPPLRHHIDDVRRLVPFLISRLTRGADLTCSPEAMRILTLNRWPGNIEQLYQVIRKILAHRRSGIITPADLPAEVHSTARRVLTPIESIECDAIVAALRDAHGNRAKAARHLGMSRATIYRKVREYGIVVPPTTS